jgi:lipopolysaccharide heptosyltransferase II
VRALRARRFDTAFILRRSLSRSLLLALAGIPMRVGFANPKSGWVLTHRVVPSPAPQHKAWTYLQLSTALGWEGPPQPCTYTVGDEERSQALRWLEAKQWVEARPLVLLHPGANWAHKRWPSERFAELGERLVSLRQVRVLITGGPGDWEVARSVAERVRSPAACLVEPMGLRQLGALLEQVHLVVSNDTGVLHLAAALQRPLVALYGPTSPSLTGPLGEPGRLAVLHHADCCPRIPCREPDHPSHLGMEAISVDETYQAACSMLEVGSTK